MREKVPEFQEHDRVTKGDEVGVVIIKRNRETGETFPLVWILEGPRKGRREYPRRGWTVDLDWTDRDYTVHVCAECEREFRLARVEDAGELREIFCKECMRQMKVREARQDGATIRDQRLSARKRVVSR